MFGRIDNNSMTLCDTDPISSKGYYRHTGMSNIANGEVDLAKRISKLLPRGRSPRDK